MFDEAITCSVLNISFGFLISSGVIATFMSAHTFIVVNLEGQVQVKIHVLFWYIIYAVSCFSGFHS